MVSGEFIIFHHKKAKVVKFQKKSKFTTNHSKICLIFVEIFQCLFSKNFIYPSKNLISTQAHQFLESPADHHSQVYHLPKVHEAEQTYTVPAKQTLIQPFIGGSRPITPHLTPQPQYIYIPSPHHHQNYIPQAQ